jgi:Cu-Zn family superoxide dismutase
MISRRTLIRLAALLVPAALLTVALAAAPGALGGGALRAEAALVDTAGSSVGWARFVEDATGVVHLSVHVKGFTPGLHGIHIHAIGTCTLGTTPPFSSAGGHHNPLGHSHGLLSPTGPHAGDLPNLIVNEDGIGHLDTTTELATQSAGTTSIFDADGSALVIHALVDDQVTNATGNSGARIACGPILAD